MMLDSLPHARDTKTIFATIAIVRLHTAIVSGNVIPHRQGYEGIRLAKQ